MYTLTCDGSLSVHAKAGVALFIEGGSAWSAVAALSMWA